MSLNGIIGRMSAARAAGRGGATKDFVRLNSLAHTEMLLLDEWKGFTKNLEEREMVQITVHDATITIAGFEEQVQKAKEEILKYLIENGEDSSREFPTNYGYALDLVHHNTEFQDLCKQEDVKYEARHGGIVLEGKKYALHKVIDQLTRWNAQIQYNKELLSEHNVLQYFEDDSKKKKLAKFRERHKCTILVGSNGWPSEVRTGGLRMARCNLNKVLSPPSSPPTRHEGIFTVSVRQGDITDEKSDAIVNSTGADFNLSKGLVSKTIISKVGPQIQQLVSQASGELVRVTSGGQLACNHIIHVVAPDKVEAIKERLIDVLREAENLQCSSLSIPAIGTGKLGLESGQVATVMREAFLEAPMMLPYIRHLKTVNVVIFEENMVEEFRSILAMTVNASKGPIESENADNEPVSPESDVTDAASLYNTFGCLKVTVRQGDITEESNDAIANSTGPNFNLSKGLVSRAILDKGGQEIQQQVTTAEGETIRVTKGGELKCKYILHAVAPDKVERIKQCIIDILEQADMLECASLSIPAIGTGKLGLSCGDVAELMGEAFRDFAKDRPQTKTLRQVDVVLHDASKLADFETGIFRQSPGDPLKNTVIYLMERLASGILFVVTWVLYLVKNFSTIAGKACELWESDKNMTRTSNPWTILGSLKVSVRQGEIVDEQNDAVVNIVMPGFDLSQGSMSPAVLAIAGEQIQDEINRWTDSELRVTSPGNLNCKKIIHVAVPHTVDDIRSLLKRILREAESQRCTSISIPPIGADQGLSYQEIAELMVQVFHGYAAEVDENAGLQAIEIVFPAGADIPPEFGHAISSLGSAHVETNQDKLGIIHFYCKNQKHLKEAKTSVSNLLGKDFCVDYVEDKSIGSLTAPEREAIEKLADECGVRLEYKSAEKKILVDGLKDGVWKAVKAIQRALHEFSEARILKTFASYVWRYQLESTAGKSWSNFAPQAEKILEESYRKHLENCHPEALRVSIHFEERLQTFRVDFDHMTMHGRNQFDIRRETKDEFPANWNAMDDETSFMEIPLKPLSAEYKDVKEKMHATLPNCQIQSVNRVQNKNLYIRYKNQRRQISKTSANKKIEHQLFHGTSEVKKIIKYGFDRNYAGDRNAALYGQGTYFAVNASYSDQSKYASPNASGVKAMILADVLTGDYCEGQKGMKSAPQKPNSDDVYDSLVNDVSNPTIFVVFPDASMYPAYVIKYKRGR